MFLAFFFAELLPSNAKPLEQHWPARAVQMQEETSLSVFVCTGEAGWNSGLSIWSKDQKAVGLQGLVPKGERKPNQERERGWTLENAPVLQWAPHMGSWTLHQPIHFFSNYGERENLKEIFKNSKWGTSIFSLSTESEDGYKNTLLQLDILQE